MSAMDRLRKILLWLKNLGQEQIELSKMTRLKEGEKVDRIFELTWNTATSFERHVTVEKNLADVYFVNCKASKQEAVGNTQCQMINLRKVQVM